MKRLLVYLDNSDYSNLSKLSASPHRFDDVLNRLTNLKSEQVIYCFSGTMLSEISPLRPAFSDAANRRAEALVGLCGRNALISIDRLIAAEIQALICEATSPPSVHSPTGDWFPSNIEALSPVKQLELVAELQSSLRSMAPNRKARRYAESKSIKREQVSSAMRKLLVSGAREGTLDEILSRYPMRPDDARVLARFVVGDATAAEANAAFLETLRDPRWMMSWFERNHSELNSFTAGVRKPAESLANTLRELVEKLRAIREGSLRTDAARRTSEFDAKQWENWHDTFLVGLCKRLARDAHESELLSITPALIDERCPGLSVGVRSLLSAWRSSLTAMTPRAPKNSDFPDAVHAMYAPYVQIFRADAFMAPHIQKLTKRFGTAVVSKLEELPSTIQEQCGVKDSSGSYCPKTS